VDLNAGQWHIPAEFIKTAEDYHAPVPASVVTALKEFKAEVAESCKRQGVSVGKRLSADATIFGLTPTSDINPAFRTAVKRAGLTLTLHDLRRVYLNRLRENGVSLETAMALTGHRSVATVMKYYREVSQQDLASAVRSIDATATRENTAEAQGS